MCSLSKEDFLIRAPPFMGDILWAHLEILQKEVDKEHRNSLESIHSNYSDSFSTSESFNQRTYTQLDTAPQSHQQQQQQQQQQQSMSPGMSHNQMSGCRSVQYGSGQQTNNRNNGYPQQMDYQHNNNNTTPNSTNGGGSIVDSSSEYSYHGIEMKYSAQMTNSRVPVYPTHHGYPDHYSGENLWPYNQMPPSSENWHQDFSVSSSAGSMSSLAPPPPLQPAPNGMHHHPVFMQVMAFPLHRPLQHTFNSS
jgi:hypothetical protein